MRHIEIWLCGETAARDGHLAALVRALGDAGVRARRARLPQGPRGGSTAAPPLPAPPRALVWQARDDGLGRARLLAEGVADIIGPWMHPAEALARSLRHARAPDAAGTQLRLGELEIDLIEREAWRRGRTLGLLRREFELLHFLARRPDRPQSRAALLGAVWRIGFDPGTNVVEVHVSRLRAKLDRGYDWPMLRTVRGAGYALVTGAAD